MTCFLDDGGPRIAYEIVGPDHARTTALCVHGNSSHRGLWTRLARELAAEVSVRMLLLDMRGHGESDRVRPPAYNPVDHASDLERVVTSLALDRFVLIGHSAGALAAASLIVQCNRGLANCKPASAMVWIDIDPCVPSWQVAYFNERASSVARPYADLESATRAIMRGIQKTSVGVPDEALRDFVTNSLVKSDEGWKVNIDPQTFATWSPDDLRPMLEGIGCATLVLRGADSVVSSVEGVADLRRGLPVAEYHEIAQATHFLLLEQPAATARLIADFLRRNKLAD